MKLQLSDREFRLLFDLVYAGNWVINTIRGDDRSDEYEYVCHINLLFDDYYLRFDFVDNCNEITQRNEGSGSQNKDECTIFFGEERCVEHLARAEQFANST